MKILLVYPNYPDTFWSFRYALKFIDRKASLSPAGASHGGRHAPRRVGKKTC